MLSAQPDDIDCGAQRNELDSVFIDDKEHGLHPSDTETISDLRGDDHAINRLIVTGGERLLRCSAWKMQTLRPRVQHAIRTPNRHLNSKSQSATSGMGVQS